MPSAFVWPKLSTILDAPTGAVWDVLRDFNGHDRWHPAVVLTGHVHQAPFVEGGSWIAPTAGGTWVVNAGRQIGPVPTRIAIDLGAEDVVATAARTARAG